MAEKSSKNRRYCNCVRAVLYRQKKVKKKDQSKRKRQTLVYNAEGESYHEPYMRNLRKEFSDVSIMCDSKIELPWKDIALPIAGMKIRKITSMHSLQDEDVVADEVEDLATEKKSTGLMVLPWHDLVISDTVQSANVDLEPCGSSLEIPWSDLTLEKPMEIRAAVEENTCDDDDVEIPWDDLLIPRNIEIEPQKRKKHPSSGHPPRIDKPCTECKHCCAKVTGGARTNAFCSRS